jgi:hypothetical protein
MADTRQSALREFEAAKTFKPGQFTDARWSE